MNPLMIHVAVLHQPYIEAILDGSKTVESRLMLTRRAPFGALRPGDLIYFKQSSGPFRLAAAAGEIEEHEGLSPARVAALQRRYGPEVGAPREYWRAKARARYAVFIRLRDIRTIARGPSIPPLNGRGWLCLPQARAAARSVA